MSANLIKTFRKAAGWLCRKPAYIAVMTALLYLGLTAFMLGRTPDLQPQLKSWPDQFFLFIHPGDKWDIYHTRPFNTENIGYDGQFYYDLARSPLDPATRLDKPAYRTARLLYPLLARTLSAGQAALLPIVMLLINLVAITFTVFGLTKILVYRKQTPLWALGYAIWPGTLCGYFYDLAEPLCFALVVGGIWLFLRLPKAIWRVGLLFLLASLTKELGLLWGLGWLLYYLTRREWQSAAKLAVIWLLPFGVWQFWLQLKFGVNGLSAGEPFSWFPLAGYFGASSYHPPLIERLALLTTTVIPLGWSSLNLWRNHPAAALKTWLTRQEPLFYTWLIHGLFLLFLPAASFVYLVDHARNFSGLMLVLYLWPLHGGNGLRKYLVVISLFWSLVVLVFLATTSNAFLYSFGI